MYAPRTYYHYFKCCYSISGNMWAQQWNNIESLLLPFPDKPSVDVTDELLAQVSWILEHFDLLHCTFSVVHIY